LTLDAFIASLNRLCRDEDQLRSPRIADEFHAAAWDLLQEALDRDFILVDSLVEEEVIGDYEAVFTVEASPSPDGIVDLIESRFAPVAGESGLTVLSVAITQD
jgi:hypothetical protein